MAGGRGDHSATRPLVGSAGVAVAVLVAVAAVSGFVGGGAPAGRDGAGADGAATPTPGAGLAGAALDPAPTTSTSPVAGPARTATRRPPAGLTAADVAAGLRSRTVPDAGRGTLGVVRGNVAAPGPGQVVRVRVEVERGLDIDRQAFARFVLATLNDPRSWSHGGARSFARTEGPAAIRVVLASPRTSAGMCRPLITYGRLSCRSGDAAVLTLYRWVKAIDEYRGNRTGYRRYVVNHEVGHLLRHGHQQCPGAGRRAPLMMQQTKGLQGCRPNPWPYP